MPTVRAHHSPRIPFIRALLHLWLVDAKSGKALVQVADYLDGLSNDRRHAVICSSKYDLCRKSNV